MKKIVINLDIFLNENGDFSRELRNDLVDQILEFSRKGFKVVISTSSFGRHYSALSASPFILHEIKRFHVDLSNVVFGNPDVGPKGLLLDDKAITYDEFLHNSPAEIFDLTNPN